MQEHAILIATPLVISARRRLAVSIKGSNFWRCIGVAIVHCGLVPAEPVMTLVGVVEPVLVVHELCPDFSHVRMVVITHPKVAIIVLTVPMITTWNFALLIRHIF